MTTVRAGRDRAAWWPVTYRSSPAAEAETLAAFLVGMPPLRWGTGRDACLRTHTQVRSTYEPGSVVHRLRSSRGRLRYTTGCGRLLTKQHGVLTADVVTCPDLGCREEP